MSIVNHNNGSELSEANVGALAIVDGSIDINVAELFGLSAEEAEEDPKVLFFNDRLSCLFKDVVLFAGVQGAGAIRCASKDSWAAFGGDANWRGLLKARTLPLMYKSLRYDTLDAVGCKDLLKRLLTDATADPATSPKPISEYSFETSLEAHLDASGVTLHSFAEKGVLGPALSLPLADKFGKLADDLKAMLVEECIGETCQTNIMVRIYRRSNGEFASLVQAPTMRVTRDDDGEIFLEAETAYGAVHNFRHIVDVPAAEARVPIFWTKTGINLLDDGRPFLLIYFFDGSNEHVAHPTRILDVIERLDWK